MVYKNILFFIGILVGISCVQAMDTGEPIVGSDDLLITFVEYMSTEDKQLQEYCKSKIFGSDRDPLDIILTSLRLIELFDRQQVNKAYITKICSWIIDAYKKFKANLQTGEEETLKTIVARIEKISDYIIKIDDSKLLKSFIKMMPDNQKFIQALETNVELQSQAQNFVQCEQQLQDTSTNQTYIKFNVPNEYGESIEIQLLQAEVNCSKVLRDLIENSIELDETNNADTNYVFPEGIVLKDIQLIKPYLKAIANNSANPNEIIYQQLKQETVSNIIDIAILADKLNIETLLNIVAKSIGIELLAAMYNEGLFEKLKNISETITYCWKESLEKSIQEIGISVLNLRNKDAVYKSIIFSSDFTRVAIISHNEVSVWDVQRRKELLIVPKKNVKSVLFSPNGEKIVLVYVEYGGKYTSSMNVCGFDIETQEKLSFYGEEGKIQSMAMDTDECKQRDIISFPDNNDYIATLFNCNSIKMIMKNHNSKNACPDILEYTINNARFDEGSMVSWDKSFSMSSDESYCVVIKNSTEKKSMLRIYNMKNKSYINNIVHKHNSKYYFPMFSTDTTKILARDYMNVYVWATETGENLLKVKCHEPIKLATFNADEKYIIIVTVSGKMYRINASVGNKYRKIDVSDTDFDGEVSSLTNDETIDSATINSNKDRIIIEKNKIFSLHILENNKLLKNSSLLQILFIYSLLQQIMYGETIIFNEIYPKRIHDELWDSLDKEIKDLFTPYRMDVQDNLEIDNKQEHQDLKRKREDD